MFRNKYKLQEIIFCETKRIVQMFYAGVKKKDFCIDHKIPFSEFIAGHNWA